MRRPDGLDPRILPETEFCGDPSKPCSRQKESRKIKWKLTTKDKLREARDRERYLGR